MLLLHDNTFTGDVDHLCEASNTTSEVKPFTDSLEIFTSQCGGSNPPIGCSCCTSCCKDGQKDCVRGDLLATFDLDYEKDYSRDNEYVFSEDIVFHTH